MSGVPNPCHPRFDAFRNSRFKTQQPKEKLPFVREALRLDIPFKALSLFRHILRKNFRKAEKTF